MQKITRIYVGNYGIDMAWYDGITFDLTDPDDKAPTDTIINLENGGGKTTLLSFIFSCFETSQERFLKHIQNKNHRFGQYFAKDGLPGIVLIEWLMPARVAGGAPYRLVTGQAVALKPNAERDEVDRVFFSFEAAQGLALEAVPAPKLSMAPVTSMGEFARWMHEAHKMSPDFFHTRTQSDWQKHLRDERLIDVEMLQLQVNFSAQEGGIDTGFLSFTSEPEFVRRFFELTLDAERSAAVRLAVVNTCDKLSRKPHFQQCLNELSKVRARLTHFDEMARAYAAARQAQEDAVRQGSGLTLSLQALSRERAQAAGELAARAAEQETLASQSSQAASQCASDGLTLTALHYLQRKERAQAGASQAGQRLDGARARHTHVKAAQARSEIDALDAKIAQLESMSAQASEQLDPWRDSAQKQGALLRRALFEKETLLGQQAQSQSALEAAAQKSQKDLNEALASLSGQEQPLLREQAAIDAAESAGAAAKEQLLREGKLEPEETCAAAASRYESLARDKRSTEQQLRARVGPLEALEQACTDAIRKEAADASRLLAGAEHHDRFVAEGQAEREHLAQLSILRQAAEAQVADPDSAALVPALDRLIQAGESEVAQCDVRLAALRSSKAAIVETGVSGASRDVNEVVARLREMGVRSARPFNTYLAEALPDADKARALVASNPARFLGVCVAPAELDKARGVLERPLQLVAPVMVSITALEGSLVEADRLVLPAADDAAFNCAAAALHLTQLDARLSTEEERRGLFAQRQREALAGRQRLQTYCARFGGGALEHAHAESQRLNGQARAAAGREQEAQSQAAAHRKSLEAARSEAQACAQAAARAQEDGRAIERFARDHEAPRAARLARLDSALAELDALDGERRRMAAELLECAQAEKAAFCSKHEYQTEQGQRATERGAIKHVRKDFDAAQHLADHPQELAVLRALYEDAAKAYESESKSRLGVVHVMQEAARNERIEKAQAFAQAFPGIKTADFGPYLGADFAAVLATAEQEERAAADAWRLMDNACAVAVSEHVSYLKAHKAIAPANAAMLALSEQALEQAIGAAEQGQRLAAAAALAARGEAARCKELARRARDTAKSALDTAGALRASLSLPELLDAESLGLEEDTVAQANQVIADFQSKARTVEGARKKAYKAFDALRSAEAMAALEKVEPAIAMALIRNDFDAACADSVRLLEGIEERIATTQFSLDGMSADFENCVGELANLVNGAITLLNSATTNKKVPVGAPYVGGKAILKMRARFHELGQDVRRQHLRSYLDTLIDTNTVPANGPELVAQALLRIHGKSLGLQMLKMVPDERLQYVAVDKIQNSGGEGVVMAMFLYMLINQLRSETQAKLKKAGGGPLILDNPFAKATTPTLWKAQRMLAQAMDVQLIFATALPDYNTVGEFGQFVRLRKAGKNTKTGRWHLQAVDFKLNAQAQEASA